MALFRQKGKSTWQARIWVPRLGKVKSISTGTSDRLAAEAIEIQLRTAVAKPSQAARIAKILEELTGTDTGGMPLADALSLFLSAENLTGIKASRKRISWGKFMAFLAEKHPEVSRLPQVSNEHAHQFAEWLRESGLKANSQKSYRQQVAAIFSGLMSRAGLPSNPFHGLRVAVEDDARDGRSLTDMEVVRLLEVATGDYHTAVVVALYTGLRYKDVAYLRWDEIVGSTIQLKTAKTNRIVVIPLHPSLHQYIKSVQCVGDYVMPELARRYKSSKRNGEFSDLLARAGIVAGPGEYVSFHSLRHTFRTRLAAAGVSKDVAQRLGGWTSDISEVYNHDLTGLKRAIESLPGVKLE